MLKRYKIAVLIAALLLPVAVFAMGQRPEKPGPMVGKAAPEFVLDTLYNGTKKLSDARGDKKAVLFFWATWCPHCHEQLIRLNNSIESLKRRGFVVILVDLGESPNDVKAFLKFNTIFLDSFVDPDSSLQDIYQVVGVPTIYYLDENGVIVSEQHEFEGNIDALFGGSDKKKK